MNVYLLSHTRKLEDDAVEIKNIGVYSSMDIINIIISKYKDIAGFKDYPNDFIVKEYKVIGSDNIEILQDDTMYFLQHEYSVDESGVIYDYITDIDMFTNYDDTKKEMEKLKKEPIYANKTDGLYAFDGGFCIDKYILDENNWTEGFV